MAPFPETCTAVLPLSAQAYFLERDSAPFRALMCEVLDLGEVEWTDSWKEGNKYYHRLVTRPDYERWVPKIGRKYVQPKDLDFYDTIEYDPEQLKAPPYRLPCTSSLELLGEKLEARRTIVIDAIDDTHCRHSVEGDVRVRIFGIGRLAENGVIDSTVKTFRALPNVLERYLEVRQQMLQTESGRAALMEGRPPNMEQIDQHIFKGLQAPYSMAGSDGPSAHGSVDEDGSEDDDDDDVDSRSSAEGAPPTSGGPAKDKLASERSMQRQETLFHEPSATAGGDSLPKAGEKGRALQRSETIYYDVGEEILDEDAMWVPEEADRSRPDAPEKAQNLQSTREALAKDRKRLRSKMRKLRQRSRDFLAAELGIDMSRKSSATPAQREEDLEKGMEMEKWNDQRKHWKEFWRGAKVAAAPVPSFSGRLLQLITFGGATGWLNVHRRGESVGEDVSAQPSEESFTGDTPAADAVDRSSESASSMERKSSRQNFVLCDILTDSVIPPNLEPARVFSDIQGSVRSFDWTEEAERTAACQLIEEHASCSGTGLTEPVLLRGAVAHWPALQRWNLDWLARTLHNLWVVVRCAPSLRFTFMEPRLMPLYLKLFPATKAQSVMARMLLSEFAVRSQRNSPLAPLVYHRDAKDQGRRGTDESSAANAESGRHCVSEYYYMQTPLPKALEKDCDLAGAPFGLLHQPGREAQADMMPSQAARIWMSPMGAVSPLHFDSTTSFLTQISGRKRLLFFPPGDLPALKPYPNWHILRRRLRFDPAQPPDRHRFPAACKLKALEAVLEPGDVLLFPALWAHYTESLTWSLSLTWRFLHRGQRPAKYSPWRKLWSRWQWRT
ncbi:hypothetical protein WJX73_007729 [Symbiochloris irregularis]|uniref:JmjC domain-containing protein n=1 Tax=Symbiochloris irregularis TaxID=706552 RepID=A0AAW1P258_9CHLO